MKPRVTVPQRKKMMLIPRSHVGIIIMSPKPTACAHAFVTCIQVQTNSPESNTVPYTQCVDTDRT